MFPAVSCAVFLVLSAGFSILYATAISNEFKKLIQRIQALAGDNSQDLLPETTTREFNDLSDAVNLFHHTLNRLRKHKAESDVKLQKTKDELEIRVKDRTAALKKEIQDRALLEEKYKKVTDTTPVPIIVFDMQGNPIYINQAFTDIFGWNLEEFAREKTNYIPDEEYSLNLDIRKKIVRGIGGQRVESRRYNKKGEMLDVDISFDVWRGLDNRPAGCVVILHDITERKRMEKQLFQSQKMEAMGTLAGGIAHDFNNILSGIFAFSQLADKHAGNPQKAREHIRYIVKGAQRAAALVQQILTFCRQTEYQKQPLNLDIVLKEALKLLASTIPSTIRIEKMISPELTIEADPTQIHQVIMNLCTNAYHAMEQTGGTLTVSLRPFSVSPENQKTDITPPPGEYALLEVKDTGHGMTKEVIEKAFDPYFTTKEIGKGTGVGLALVKAIIEAHEGIINVHSTPGKGSLFSVFLPAVTRLVQEKEDLPANQMITGGNEHIMVVDDEESIRLAMSEFLEDYGYKVSTFSDGNSAFKAFEKTPEAFNLIFTDITMPGLTGDELAVRMLKIKPDIPIILCTGYTEKVTEIRALESGVRFFVQKPLSNQELDRLIRQALEPDRDG